MATALDKALLIYEDVQTLDALGQEILVVSKKSDRFALYIDENNNSRRIDLWERYMPIIIKLDDRCLLADIAKLGGMVSNGEQERWLRLTDTHTGSTVIFGDNDKGLGNGNVLQFHKFNKWFGYAHGTNQLASLFEGDSKMMEVDGIDIYKTIYGDMLAVKTEQGIIKIKVGNKTNTINVHVDKYLNAFVDVLGRVVAFGGQRDNRYIVLYAYSIEKRQFIKLTDRLECDSDLIRNVNMRAYGYIKITAGFQDRIITFEKNDNTKMYSDDINGVLKTMRQSYESIEESRRYTGAPGWIPKMIDGELI